jgi:hypothetical protein
VHLLCLSLLLLLQQRPRLLVPQMQQGALACLEVALLLQAAAA